MKQHGQCALHGRHAQGHPRLQTPDSLRPRRLTVIQGCAVGLIANLLPSCCTLRLPVGGARADNPRLCNLRCGKPEGSSSKQGAQAARCAHPQHIDALGIFGPREVGSLREMRAGLAQEVWARDAVVIDDGIFVPWKGACYASSAEQHTHNLVWEAYQTLDMP